jgi:hypothetical protein
MTKERPANGFWNYVAECLRLLYWIYFKPFTFKRWLRDIHPELKPTDNPFTKRAEFRNNPRLRRYAWQVWCLTTVMPILAVLLTQVYSVASGELFYWFISCSFWVGWFIGPLLALSGNKNRFIIVALALLSMFVTRSWSGMVANVAFSVALGVVLNVAFSVALGVVFGVVLSVIVGQTVSGMFGVVSNVVLGVMLGGACRMLLGVALSMLLGVALSVASVVR